MGVKLVVIDCKKNEYRHMDGRKRGLAVRSDIPLGADAVELLRFSEMMFQAKYIGPQEDSTA